MTAQASPLLPQIRTLLLENNFFLGEQSALQSLHQAIKQGDSSAELAQIICSDDALCDYLKQIYSVIKLPAITHQCQSQTMTQMIEALGEQLTYRYALAFYLQRNLTFLGEPYARLSKGYWALTQSITQEALESANRSLDPQLCANRLHSLCQFVFLGPLLTLAAASLLQSQSQLTISMGMLKQVIEQQQFELSLLALKQLKVDGDLQFELAIAYERMPTQVKITPGLLLRPILKRRGLL
ncbi:hypothetical protein [Paraferrimonas haliotis]|uniref:HDOD domain-containing protein n=1 Tax=Paraferrimonas haliotis TaxID=2013866 RepID=A0AA37WVB5_9GAMM|nr:hypothetical protein [Paraferrimonas haliotis]GLS82188.1 hypothetical protein GCM10007894_01650 [Paraferrimonas haliotis]